MDVLNVQACCDNRISNLHFMKSWLANKDLEILASELLPIATVLDLNRDTSTFQYLCQTFMGAHHALQSPSKHNPSIRWF